jgi:hypothetical protein
MYDSTADTLRHSLRVGELMLLLAAQLLKRATEHDKSKTEPPELDIFNEYTPRLRSSTYGSDEYNSFLAEMQTALQHHYANNRHHPEHFDNGIQGMHLVDLIEMLCDWKAATERHDDGDLARSLELQQQRFGYSDELKQILRNTAVAFGMLEE